MDNLQIGNIYEVIFHFNETQNVSYCLIMEKTDRKYSILWDCGTVGSIGFADIKNNIVFYKFPIRELSDSESFVVKLKYSFSQ